MFYTSFHTTFECSILNTLDSPNISRIKSQANNCVSNEMKGAVVQRKKNSDSEVEGPNSVGGEILTPFQYTPPLPPRATDILYMLDMYHNRCF